MACKEHALSAHRQLQERASLLAEYFLSIAIIKVGCIWVVALFCYEINMGDHNQNKKEN